MSITEAEIKMAVSGNKLVLHNKGLEDKDVKIICDYLIKNPGITSLKLST